MIPSLRPLTGLLLALMLTVTGQASVAARGGAVAVDIMVLCTGAGTALVPIDASGAPVAPAHVCPDCVVAPVDLPPGAAPLLRAPALVRQKAGRSAVRTATGQFRPRACARGPPHRV